MTKIETFWGVEVLPEILELKLGGKAITS